MRFLLLILPLLILSSDCLKIDIHKQNPSHVITNPIILTPIKEAIKREIQGSNILDVVLLRIDSISETHQAVYSKVSNFQTEMINRKQKKDPNFVGHLWVDDVLVLLYNNPNYFFKKVNDTSNIFDSAINNSLPISIHTPYYYYEYEKFEVSEEIIESIELEYVMDRIKD